MSGGSARAVHNKEIFYYFIFLQECKVSFGLTNSASEGMKKIWAITSLS